MVLNLRSVAPVPVQQQDQYETFFGGLVSQERIPSLRLT